MKTIFNRDIENNCSESANLPAMLQEAIIALLKEESITDTGVDYENIKSSPIYTDLQNTIYPCFEEFDLAGLDTNEKKIAFWINLYHLLTIDADIRFSIRGNRKNGWPGMVHFLKKAAYTIHGMRFSLIDIEYGILRANRSWLCPFLKHFKGNDPRGLHCLERIDPRIHFALNRANRSNPPIAYYSAERLDAQLDLAAAYFIDCEVELDESGVALRIPRIFRRFRQDFGGKYDVLEWIHRYLPENDPRRVLIDHFDYQTMTIIKKYN